MTEELITDKKLFETLEWLQKNGRAAAQAKAHRVYLEEYLGHLRAKLAQEGINANESAAKAEIKAKASPIYLAAIEGLKAAIEEDAYYQWHRTRCEAVVNAWQTLSANRRAIDKAL